MAYLTINWMEHNLMNTLVEEEIFRRKTSLLEKIHKELWEATPFRSMESQLLSDFAQLCEINALVDREFREAAHMFSLASNFRPEGKPLKHEMDYSVAVATLLRKLSDAIEEEIELSIANNPEKYIDARDEQWRNQRGSL